MPTWTIQWLGESASCTTLCGMFSSSSSITRGVSAPAAGTCTRVPGACGCVPSLPSRKVASTDAAAPTSTTAGRMRMKRPPRRGRCRRASAIASCGIGDGRQAVELVHRQRQLGDRPPACTARGRHVAGSGRRRPAADARRGSRAASVRPGARAGCRGSWRPWSIARDGRSRYRLRGPRHRRGVAGSAAAIVPRDPHGCIRSRLSGCPRRGPQALRRVDRFHDRDRGGVPDPRPRDARHGQPLRGAEGAGRRDGARPQHRGRADRVGDRDQDGALRDVRRGRRRAARPPPRPVRAGRPARRRRCARRARTRSRRGPSSASSTRRTTASSRARSATSPGATTRSASTCTSASATPTARSPS